MADTWQPHALAVFDVLDEWFHRCDFDCCSAMQTLTDTPDHGAAGRGTTSGELALAQTPGEPGSGTPRVPWLSGEASGELGLSRETLERYAERAGSPNPSEAGHQLQILMLGAILSAGRGDDRAAIHARSLAELLLDGSPR